MALHHYEFGRGHDPPPLDRARANLYQSNGRSASPPPAPRTGRNRDGLTRPATPIWGFDPISTFRSMERYICHRSVKAFYDRKRNDLSIKASSGQTANTRSGDHGQML